MAEPNTFPTEAQRRAAEEFLAALPDEWSSVRDDPEAHRRQLEAVEYHLEPDFVTEAIGGEFTPQSWTGIDGWLEFWRDWLAGFERFVGEPVGLIEARDRIIGLVRQRATPLGGRGQIDNDAAAVFWFRGERIARIQLVLERDRALRDAGIDPVEARASSRS